MDIIHQNEIRRDLSPIYIFSLTLFSSATLMFIMQPMFGKALLPLLGGSASVWNTCMVFYQSVLFLGYLYAHWLSTRVSYKKHLIIHFSVMLAGLLLLPIGLPENSHPPASDNPTGWLLVTLLSSIGLPFFVLSTTSPLLQKWFSKIGHQTSHDPYYLSIASNAGSLIALLGYPFLIEPSIGIQYQQELWSLGFIILLALVGICMLQLKPNHWADSQSQSTRQITTSTSPTLKQQFKWLILAFVPSSLLLGTTNFISIDIASVPLLWVIPLALYLLSFILVFSAKARAIHKRMLLLQPWLVAPFLAYYFSQQKLASFTLEIFLHLLIFFICIMVCHGELAKKRPSTDYLTRYYLIMSFGGMLGGVFNNFVAPFIFSSIFEYPLMIILTLLLNPIHHRIKLYLKQHGSKIVTTMYLSAFAAMLLLNIHLINPLIISAIMGSAFILAFVFYHYKKPVLYLPLFGILMVSCAAPEKQGNQLLHQSRNFYGILSVKQKPDLSVGNQKEEVHVLYSGTTRHGLQIVSDTNLQCTPYGYYHNDGPIGSVFKDYDAVNKDWQIGVIGLGAGTLASYAKPTQHWSFFELDPEVIDIAENSNYFTYLTECIDDYQIQLGDARLALENDASRYDLLVVDAFTSDSIPTHLLTREAIELYFSRLSDSGLLAFHISNRYLELKKVLANHAQRLGLSLLVQEFRPESADFLTYRSDWAILSRHPETLTPLKSSKNTGQWQEIPNYARTEWTDDFTSIIHVWK
jgi:hypothetical protein